MTRLPARRAIAALLILSLAFSAVLAAAQQGPTLEIDIDHAAVLHGESDEWDGKYTDPGAVMFHDGQFHMFRNGFLGWPASVQIGYLTSPDGLTWTEVSPDPVLLTDDVPSADVAALASSALVEPDGTWVLYLYLWGQRRSDPESWGIARATAPDPAGPWTPDDAPILLPGPEGAWDAARVSDPSVTVTDEGYVMYYTGVDADDNRQVGMATSEDGIHWTKYDDPATADAPYAESDPVFRPAEDSEAWDATFIEHPRVVQTPDGWLMAYRSASRGNAEQGYGLATSADGLNWTHAAMPLIDRHATTQRSMWYGALAYHDGATYLYLELQRGYQSQTDIYAGTIEGDPFS
jgi:hypothetical protein